MLSSLPMTTSAADMWLEPMVRSGELDVVHLCPVLVRHGTLPGMIGTINQHQQVTRLRAALFLVQAKYNLTENRSNWQNELKAQGVKID